MQHEENINGRLHPEHLADLRKSGLSDKIIAQAGIYSVCPSEIKRILGYDLPELKSLLAFPYPNNDFVRYRLYPSLVDEKGHKKKYHQPPGSGAHLYTPHQAHEILKDPGIPLAWAEGEKKALKACQEGIPCIGLGGIWNWTESATKSAIAEIDRIAHIDREEIIYFDSDIWANPLGLQALYAFAKELEERGAIVKVAVIPHEGEEKQGLDDFLVAEGAEALKSLQMIPLTHKAFDQAKKWWKGWKKEAKATTEAKEQYTALFPGLVDVVEYEDKPAFLVKDGSELKILSQVEIEGTRYLPPPKDHIPWLLPRADGVLRGYREDSDQILYNDLLTYHKSVSELSDDSYYDLLAIWDFHNYSLDKVQYSPYLYLFAVPERGKSRTGKGLIYVAYRGIHVESLRDAYLVRVANNYCATLFIDTLDLWRKAEKNGTEDLLLQRYERGACVPRVLYPEKGPHNDTVYFKVFGATTIATNEPVSQILESRALQINMPDSSRHFEDDVTPEGALSFKERLVAFRARHLDEKLPPAAKPTNGRLGDITRPLIQTIRLVNPSREHVLITLIRELEEQRKSDKSETLEAKILTVISDNLENMAHGMLAFEKIVKGVNADLPEKWHSGERTIGRKLAALGMKTKKIMGNRFIPVPPNIENILYKYGVRQNGTNGTNGSNPYPERDCLVPFFEVEI